MRAGALLNAAQQQRGRVPWMVPSLGQEGLYGTKLGWADLARFLKPLDPEHVIAACGWFTTQLYHSEEERLIYDRAKHWLFPLDRHEKLDRHRAKLTRPDVTPRLMGEHHLTVLARQALLHCQGTHRHGDDFWRKCVSSALLVNNDICTQPAGVDITQLTVEPTSQNRWLLFRSLLPLSVLVRNQIPAHAIARAIIMFSELAHRYQSDPEFVDFDNACQAAIGMTLDELMTFGLLLMAALSKQAGPNPQLTPAALLDIVGLPKAAVERAMHFFVQPVEVAVRREQERILRRPFEPFDHIVLQQHPIIRFGDRLIAPCYKLLMERVTSGIYYVLLDAVPRSYRDNQRFFNFVGRLFHAYCDELLSAASRAIGSDYLPSPTLGSGKQPDGRWSETDGTVFFEFKGGMLNFDAAVAAHDERLRDCIDRVLVEATDQLADAVRAARASGNLGRIHAVIVTQYPLAADALLMGVLKDRMLELGKSLDIFRDAPLLVVHVSELERLEPVLAKSRWSLTRLLSQWHDGPAEDLHNFLYATRMSGWDDQNPWLRRIAEAQSNRWLSRLG